VPELDGFTVRRTGDTPTNVRIIMYVKHSPEQYKLKDELGEHPFVMP
jgi:hypothetical protein